MTPQERQMVTDLFDRLAQLENSPRDKDAVRAISDGLAQAPNAVYSLVQTVLVQDEALKRADARIRELTGADDSPAQGGGFLDSMREAFTRSTHTSVPTVRANAADPDPRWNRGGILPQAAAPAAPSGTAPAQGPGFGGGGSFLGTAAASAAGMIGGSLLLNSISSMFGSHGGSAFGAVPPSSASPWSDSAAGSDLSRDAGLNDIGSAPQADRSAGLFGGGDDDTDVADLGGDLGGGDGGGDSA